MKLNALLLLAAASSALAQSVIDYTKIPECARQCAVLDQAEKGCVPPAAQPAEQATYQSCFCQSAFLIPLHSTGQQCEPGCSQEDAVKISQYYKDLCAGPVVQPPAQTTVQTSTSTTSTSTATADVAKETTRPGEERGKEWWDSHYQYVIMVIVIFCAILFFWIGGVWLRRRFERKAEAKRANLAASDAPYNPNGNAATAHAGPNVESPPEMAMTALPPVAETGRHRLRSRSSTLSGLGGSSKATTPQPVVWGPHQHLAHTRGSNNASPGPSIPPSPTIGIEHPAPFRNREAARSDPRFSSYRGTRDSINEEINYSSPSLAQGRPPYANPSASSDSIERPLSAMGHQVRDVKRRTLTAAKSETSISMEPQSAQILETSPHKLQKAPKH